MAKKEIHMKSMGISDEFIQRIDELIQRITACRITGVISDLKQTSGTSYTDYIAPSSLGEISNFVISDLKQTSGTSYTDYIAPSSIGEISNLDNVNGND